MKNFITSGPDLIFVYIYISFGLLFHKNMYVCVFDDS